MRRIVAAWPAIVLALAATSAPAAVASDAVSIESAGFAPQQIDVLPGDTVEWTNVSNRMHTVTADDASFDSAFLTSGDKFSHQFTTPGMYMYHCQVHPGMTGEVDVRRVILNPLTAGPVLKGQAVVFAGRTADGSSPVAVQRSTPAGFKTVASVTPGADGSWSVKLAATSTADYRATSGGDISETRRVLVTDRALHVHAARRAVSVTVTPPDPGATVVLELYLRERFGWWPVRSARLDYLSRAGFRIQRPARARVMLVARDGWTPLLISRPLRPPRAAP